MTVAAENGISSREIYEWIFGEKVVEIFSNAEKDLWAALAYADLYKNEPYAHAVIEKAAKAAAEENPMASH